MYYNTQDKYFEKEVKKIILDCLSEKERLAYEEELAKQKEIKPLYRPAMTLPKGCEVLGCGGRFTIIEVKHTILPDTPLQVFQRIRTECRNSKRTGKHDIVLIYSSSPYAYFDPHFPGRVKLISEQDLYDLTGTKYKFRRRDTEHPSWDEKKDACKKAFNKGGCTLFIGAGMGMAANLPGWNELLSRILNNLHTERQIRKRDQVCFKHAFDGSNMVMARYLRILSESSGDFIKNVRDALYAAEANKDAELLKSVVKLVHCSHDGKRSVSKIITYNYDDLLEDAIWRKSELEPIIFCHEESKEKCGINQFPIYHVHGLISKYYSHTEKKDRIVLSEETYNDLFNNTKEDTDKKNNDEKNNDEKSNDEKSRDRKCKEIWPNRVQRQALKGSTCIFVGMSMNDPNLRRLLENTRSKNWKKCKHYAFLSKQDFYNDMSFIPQKEIVDKMFYELGVNVIWYNDHEELPNLLMELTN